MPDTQGLDAFGRMAALAMDEVGRFDDRVALNWYLDDPRKAKFTFHDENGGFEVAGCERSQWFEIIASSNAQATFNVGACRQNARRVAELARAAGTATKKMLDRLLPSSAAKHPGRSKLEDALAYRRSELPGGRVGHTFAVMIIGHGIIMLHTAVVEDPKRRVTFAVQGEAHRLCGRYEAPPKPYDPSAFCPDTEKALLEVAASLARRDAASGR